MAFIKIAESREARMPRAEAKAALRANGVSSRAAEEIVDLAIHSAARGMDAFFSTLEVSAGSVRMNALSIGVAILKSEVAVLEDAMNFATAECGLKTTDITVTRQAHG